MFSLTIVFLIHLLMLHTFNCEMVKTFTFLVDEEDTKNYNCSLIRRKANVKQCFVVTKNVTTWDILNYLNTTPSSHMNDEHLTVAILPNNLLELVEKIGLILKRYTIGISTDVGGLFYSSRKFHTRLGIDERLFSEFQNQLAKMYHMWQGSSVTVFLDISLISSRIWTSLMQSPHFRNMELIDSNNLSTIDQMLISNADSSCFLILVPSRNISHLLEIIKNSIYLNDNSTWIFFDPPPIQNVEWFPKYNVLVDMRLHEELPLIKALLMRIGEIKTKSIAEVIRNTVKNISDQFPIRVSTFVDQSSLKWYSQCSSFSYRHKDLCNCLSIADNLKPGPDSQVTIATSHLDHLVVTRIKPQISRGGDFQCEEEVPCLKFHSESFFQNETSDIREIFRQYISQGQSPSKKRSHLLQEISLYCCGGVVVSLLKELSRDLKIEPLLYIIPNSAYGTMVNGYWSGLIREVVNSRALLAVGALTITSERTKAVEMSQPLFTTGYSAVFKNERNYQYFEVIFTVFEPSKWIAILVLTCCMGGIMSFMEWKSPYGLNLNQYKSQNCYSLGCGLHNAFATLFRQTVRGKLPQSWPVRFLQNAWACISIFIIASYTAHVANSFIKRGTRSFQNIINSTNSKIGVVSAFESKIALLHFYPGLKDRLVFLNSTPQGVQAVMQESVDAYVDDTMMLEHYFYQYHNFSRFTVENLGFGNISYGIAFPSGSWLKNEIDNLIIRYHEDGYLEHLLKRYEYEYRKNVKCSSNFEMANMANTSGAFVLLSAGFLLSLFLFGLEWFMFYYLIPRWRKLPQSHKFKGLWTLYISENMHHLFHSSKCIKSRQETGADNFEMVNSCSKTERGQSLFGGISIVDSSVKCSCETNQEIVKENISSSPMKKKSPKNIHEIYQSRKTSGSKLIYLSEQTEEENSG